MATAAGNSYAYPPNGRGVVYYYKVAALVGTLEGLPGNEAAGWDLLPIPSKVVGLSASQGTLYGKVAVSWPAAANATHYDLYVSTAQGDKGAPAILDFTGTTYEHAGLTDGAHHYYTVVAKNGTGSAPDSSQAEGYGKVPATIGTLTATQGTQTGKVGLAWVSDPDATSYEVWRSTTPGGISTKIASPTAPSSGVDDGAVSGVSSYYYTVKTMVGIVSGLPGNEAEGWANGAPTGASVTLTTSSAASSAATAPAVTDPNTTAGKDESYALAVTTQPEIGAVTVADNKFVYTPPSDGAFSGALAFAFTATDKGGETVPGSGTINVVCDTPGISSFTLPLPNVPQATPFQAIGAFSLPACSANGQVSVDVIDGKGDVVGAGAPIATPNGDGLTKTFTNKGPFTPGDYTVRMTASSNSGIVTKTSPVTVVAIALPTLTVSPSRSVTAGEEPVAATLAEPPTVVCPLTGDMAVAMADPSKCHVAFTASPPGMAVDNGGVLPSLSGMVTSPGSFPVTAEVHKSDGAEFVKIGEVSKTVTAVLAPEFVFSGDTDVYAGIEKVSLTFRQSSGTACDLYVDLDTAKTKAATGKRACFANFDFAEGQALGVTRPPSSPDQAKLEGVFTAAGIQTITYAVKEILDDGSASILRTGSLSVTVTAPPPPTVTLKGGHKIADGKYYVPRGQAITRATIAAGIPTNAKMKLSVSDSRQTFERDKVTSDDAYWITTPTLDFLEERPVTLRVAWQDYPSVYNEQVITAVGGTENNMKLVMEAPQRTTDTENITVKVKVGKYTRTGLNYMPETMGQWRTRIMAQTDSTSDKTPVTEMKGMVDGVAEFLVNPAGNLFMKLTAVSELVTDIDGLDSTLASSARFVEVVKGSPIEGVITAKTLDAPAPKAFTLNLEMTQDNRAALKEVAWEESTDGGITWVAIEKSNTSRHSVGIPDPGRRQVRVRMVNKNTLAESHTAPVEVWAYATLDAIITGPRHMAPGYTATLASELYREGVLTADTVNEWKIEAPSGTTTAIGPTVTVTEALAGKVTVTLKTRPADTRADDPDAWSVARHYLSVKTPGRPSVSANGPSDIETGNTYRYEGTVKPSWGSLASAHALKSEWQKPDGSTVSGNNLDWTPTAADMADPKPLIFRAWVDGFKETTTVEKTVTGRPWEYVWPNFTVGLKQQTVEAPSNIILVVKNDRPDMGRHFEGLTYEWSFPNNVTGSQSKVLPSQAAANVTYAGEYDVTVTIRDTRGHETVLTQHVVAEQAPPYAATLKVGRSNVYERAPMTVNARPTIHGGHPLDSLISQTWKVDGISVDEFTNRSFMASTIADAGNHVISYTLGSKMGETITVELPLNLVSNQPPVCVLTAKPSSYVVYAEAKCTDPDGKVVGYSWNVNGDPIGSTSYRIGFSKTATPQSASVTITAMDDAKELSTPVSINVNY